MNKIYGIQKQFVLTIFLAALLAAGVFGTGSFLGNVCMERYYLSEGRHEKRMQEKRDELQQFIYRHSITSEQVGELYEWQKENPDVYFDVYLPDASLYDSTDQEEEDTLDGYYYNLAFTDCTARLYLFWPYFLKLQTAVVIGSVLAASCCFFLTVLLYIRRVICRIKKLEQEVSILEGGGLDYEIHPDGNDEITSLAYGLEQMRQAFRKI